MDLDAFGGAGTPQIPAPFPAHPELLQHFLAHRDAITGRIESVLNAQRKFTRPPGLLSRDFDACFSVPNAVAEPARMRGELEAAHWARGFRPRLVQHLHNDLIDPVEMMLRAVHCWQRTHWPGSNGRVHYAHTLFNLYVLRWLQFLSMRLWDHDLGGAGGRLRQIQGLLDQLWRGAPPGQPAFVRDARWLIPLAQSLITDELAPYFEIARQVSELLPAADALETQKAHVRMLGGHLTSQVRYYSTKERVSIDEASVVRRTRASNALDLALLVQGLVSVLEAYEQAVREGDEPTRINLAGAIAQGISPDPELFLNRTELLNAYTMIEHVFIAPNSDGQFDYTPQGQRHVRLLSEFSTRLDRLIGPFSEDLPRLRPVEGGCSPYGILCGLPCSLIEHMALKAVQHDAETRFSLEDAFDDAPSPTKLAWVNGWREMPHIPLEVRRAYDYPQPFAEEIYARIVREVRRRQTGHALPAGRLTIATDAGAEDDLSPRFFYSSDERIVAAGRAEVYEAAQLLRDRQEAHFLVSYETAGGWMALKKGVLTEVLAAGRDAKISGLPPAAEQVLQLMCAGLMVRAGSVRP